MENVKFGVSLSGGKNFLSLTADLSEEEVSRLTPELRLFLGQTNTGEGIVNVPLSLLV